MVVRRDSVNRCTKARNSLVADAVRRALADALAGGMSPDELRDLFESELAKQAVRTARRKSRDRSLTSFEILPTLSVCYRTFEIQDWHVRVVLRR